MYVVNVGKASPQREISLYIRKLIVGTNPNNKMNMVTPSGRKYALYSIRDFIQDRVVLYVLTVENPIHIVLVS